MAAPSLAMPSPLPHPPRSTRTQYERPKPSRPRRSPCHQTGPPAPRESVLSLREVLPRAVGGAGSSSVPVRVTGLFSVRVTCLCSVRVNCLFSVCFNCLFPVRVTCLISVRDTCRFSVPCPRGDCAHCPPARAGAGRGSHLPWEGHTILYIYMYVFGAGRGPDLPPRPLRHPQGPAEVRP